MKTTCDTLFLSGSQKLKRHSSE